MAHTLNYDFGKMLTAQLKNRLLRPCQEEKQLEDLKDMRQADLGRGIKQK